ncbi:hypothetical protein B0H34DRAFT_683853 [Crassisporium funariophilum]|nr:hypothetical protein B0H34DRAFT_683853 [Crassisporium funariophilum]
MTAVLSPTDAFRKDRHMSLDDNNHSYPSSTTDWRDKYNEVADMLAETRAELDDFHQASKELEAELENELQRTEMAQQDLKAKVVRAEGERDEWKTKFMSLQTTHNTTTTSLQRELDRLRQDYQKTKVHLRELEMGNDDLERNERAVSSSLADMENKYSRALEEKILLEHELLEKANLEEETQRLKDELRDANVEISILRDSIKATSSRESIISQTHQVQSSRTSIISTEDLLKTLPPSDLNLADISPSENVPPEINTTPKASMSRSTVSSNFFNRSGIHQDRASPLTALRNSSNIMRSTTLPSLSSPSTSSPRGLMRPPAARTPSILSTTGSTGSVAKSKGVQMVSDMRARVRVLEQKITRVPRLRMGSITGRPSHNPSPGPSTPVTGPGSSSSAASVTSTAKTSWESQRRSIDSRRSNDSGNEKIGKREVGDSSGWVLIMEDSPSPQKDKEAKRLKDKRRLSNPPAPTAFRPGATVKRAPSPSLSTGAMHTLGVSTGLRRPQSRLSGGGSSTTSSASRPQTPTFLPVPNTSSYVPSTSVGLKRSTGPNAPNPYNQMKRSSLGKANMSPPPPLPTVHRERPTTMPPIGYSGSSANDAKALPTLPDFHSNVTIRASSRTPSTGVSVANLLNKSRIGRPSREGITGRRSGGGETVAALNIQDLMPRSGSPAAN